MLLRYYVNSVVNFANRKEEFREWTSSGPPDEIIIKKNSTAQGRSLKLPFLPWYCLSPQDEACHIQSEQKTGQKRAFLL